MNSDVGSQVEVQGKSFATPFECALKKRKNLFTQFTGFFVTPIPFETIDEFSKENETLFVSHVARINFPLYRT